MVTTTFNRDRELRPSCQRFTVQDKTCRVGSCTYLTKLWILCLWTKWWLIIFLLSAPELKAPFVVRRPSAVVNFSHYRLLWNRWMEFAETWQVNCLAVAFSLSSERNSATLDRNLNAFHEVCVFWADRKNHDYRPGLWLADTLLSSPLNVIEWKLTGGNSQRPLPSVFVCFVFLSGRSENQDGRPGLWLAETFSTSPLNRIQRKRTGSKISTSSTKFLFFGPIKKQGTQRAT